MEEQALSSEQLDELLGTPTGAVEEVQGRFTDNGNGHKPHAQAPLDDGYTPWYVTDDEVKPQKENEAQSEQNSDQEDDEAEISEMSMKDAMIELALQRDITLFVDKNDKAYCRTPIKSHYANLRVDSEDFSDWLRWLLYNHDNRSCSKQTAEPAQSLLRSKAKYETERTIELNNRVARHDGNIYYDMSDRQWRVIKVAQSGWQVERKHPILFRRYGHQQPQVEPERIPIGQASETLDEVFRFVNLGDDDDQLLYKVYLVSLFIPDIAHPIPVLHGEHGSGKSYLLRTTRQLADPSSVNYFSMSTNVREFVQQLSHNWCAYYDNVSKMQDWQQDALCRAVTGEGSSKRALYSDEKDVIFKYRRCVAINGINVATTRADLLDRAILWETDPIFSSYQGEGELNEERERLQPRFLGAILAILSEAMSVPNDPERVRHFRMADWAAWGYRIAEAMDHKGQRFIEAYEGAIDEKTDKAIEANALATTMVEMMKGKEGWKGTPTQLHDQLVTVASRLSLDTTSNEFPSTPSWLGRKLKRVRPDLRKKGINYELHRTSDERYYTLTAE